MSLIKANAVQVGQSPTATQNFTLAVPSSPDGTIKLARGNAGATTQDVLSVDASGNINGLVKSTGSTTARSLANRFADVINVKDFGAVGDGVTDDTAAIQTAVAKAKINNGGIIYFPNGDYKITSTILIDEQNITLQGAGGGGYKAGIQSIRDSAATRIIWAGDSISPMILFETPNGTGGKSRGGLENIMLDCQNTAKHGLKIVSWSLASFVDITIYGAIESQIYLCTKVLGTLSNNPYDCYRNYFRNVFTTCKNLTNNSKSLVLGAGESGGSANSCYNMFEHCYFTSSENLGVNSSNISLENTDNNIFFHCQIGRLHFQSSDQDVSGNAGASRYNWVIACEGNVVAVSSSIGGTNSFGNNVIGLNNSNGTGNVYIDSGSQLNVSDMYGFITKQKLKNGFVVGNIDPINESQLVSISSNDLTQEGSVWIKNNLSTAPSPYIRITSSRSDANNGTQFSSRIALDSYRSDSSIHSGKPLGVIQFGGSTVANSQSRDDVYYSSAIIGRSAGDYVSGANCPSNIEFASGSSGSTMGNFASPIRMKIKHTGAVQFVPLTSDPSTAEEGDCYYNSTTKTLRFYNGSTWANV